MEASFPNARLGCLWPAERVLHCDARVLVVDKPWGLTLQGGGDAEDDVPARLREWLQARGHDAYLGIHQRLDVGASGVLLFSRDTALNAAIAQDFEQRRVSKRYVAAVTLKQALPPVGTLRHQLLVRKGEPTRVVAHGGSEARAEYRILAQRADRALVELQLGTGRTHQLRVQLAAVGAPIAGDELYGGSPAFRLMLHARELVVPALDACFTAQLPAEFEQWLQADAPALGSADTLRTRLNDALCRRRGIENVASAYRLVNDIGDGLPGFTADRYADWVVLDLVEPAASARLDELAARFLDLGARGVYAKVRKRADLRRENLDELAPHKPILGEEAPAPLLVREGALSFEVLLGDGLSTGLFLDQREQRRRVLGMSAGARVLNLFAYTCSFSVAAAVGGASEVVSVDLSRRALERGQANFRLNGLDPAAHRFLREDVQAWLPRALRRGEKFERIVLDPPSFSTHGKRTFRVADDYVALATLALQLLAPRGILLAVTNHRGTSRGQLRRMLHDAGRRAARAVQRIKDLPSALDCPEFPDGPAPSKAALVELSD